VSTPNPHAGGMLPTVLTLRHQPTGHTVENVEALCRKVLDAAAGGLRSRLEASDYAESLAFLLGQTAVLLDRYNPRDDRSSLGGWLKQELRWDLLDYWEAWYGRSGEKRVFDSRLLEAGARDAGVDDGDPGMDRPGSPAAEGAGDDPGAWTFPRGWLDPDGDRGGGRLLEGCPVGEGGGATPGADRGGAPAGRPDGRPTAIPPRRAPFRDCEACGWRSYPQAPNGLPGWHLDEVCLGCGAELDAAS